MENSEYKGSHAKKDEFGNYVYEETPEGYRAQHGGEETSETVDQSAVTEVEGLSDAELAKLPTDAESQTKLTEETYDNLQKDLDAINSELERKPDNPKLIAYARQTMKIMESILDGLDEQPKTAEYDKTQDAGAKTLGSANMDSQTWYQNSRGETYRTREEALNSEDDHWQIAN